MLKTQAQTIFLIHKLLKMQTQKMSLANIKGKLSRSEMKNIMAGSGGTSLCWITTTGANGSSNPSYGQFFSQNCSSGLSSAANNYCVNLIATQGNGVYHCSYNCGC
jgi:hypothetical protein